MEQMFVLTLREGLEAFELPAALVIVVVHEDREGVAAQGIAAVRLVRHLRRQPEVPRLLAVVEDDLLVEVPHVAMAGRGIVRPELELLDVHDHEQEHERESPGSHGRLLRQGRSRSRTTRSTPSSSRGRSSISTAGSSPRPTTSISCRASSLIDSRSSVIRALSKLNRTFGFLASRCSSSMNCWQALGTGAGARTRMDWHVEQLSQLAQRVTRPLTLIVRGGSAVLPALRTAFTIGGVDIDFRPFTFPIQLCMGCLYRCMQADVVDEGLDPIEVYGDECPDNAGADGRLCIDPDC